MPHLFSESLVKIVDGFDSKDQCLEQMVSMLAASGCMEFPDRFLAAVKGREEIMSTGIGKEVAIPHARDLVVNQIKIAVCLLKKPLDFQSMDNKPVKIVFMIAVPQNSNTAYMMILRSLSEYLKQEEKRLALLSCQTEEELFTKLREIEDVIKQNIKL
ncbi:MAG: PTS sugar transporter subunit IIA [Candidatus Cloacimonadaceae bacterium]